LPEQIEAGMIIAEMRFCFLFILLSTLAIRGEDWPCFRGPSHQGVSTETGLPLEWTAKSNVAWIGTIPGEGWSSPIVFGTNVFVTTATDNGVNCHVMCFETKSGKVVWSRQVLEQTPLRKEGRNSYATPTPTTDGTHIYAVFGDGSIVALNMAGDILWMNRDVKYYSQHGLGASPLLYDDLLIMPFDASSTGENKRLGWQLPWDQSFVLALDKQRGKMRWKGMRGQSRIGHVSPTIFTENGHDYFVSGAGDVVQGFDLQDGKRLWSVYSQGEGVVPSLVIGDGLIFSASGFEKPTIRAIRPPHDSGPEAKIVWEQKKGVPAVPSFVYSKPYLFAVTEGGVVSCMKADTGEQVWQERLGEKTVNVSASPVLADGRVYILADDAETTVIDPGPEFKVLGRNKLNGEKTQASMAVSNRHLFIRTEHHLFCLGSK
jgi:outer membrane protein assembly factor BamB